MKEFVDSKFDLLKETLLNNKDKYRVGDTIEINDVFFNEKFLGNDIRKSEEFVELFNHLKSIKKPVLYWFEIDTCSIEADSIRALYFEYLKTNSGRTVSSYKKKLNKTSKTLYVGKVKTGFWGRLVTHLGYHKNRKTAGLQLYHWYTIHNGLPGLKLNYIVFEKEMEDLISIFEAELARNLEPILGRY